MITTKDRAPTVYPNREQMLALIQARAATSQDAAARGDERRSTASETPWPTCIVALD
jgi:hypothetical protein